jgi:hypothetical protein
MTAPLRSAPSSPPGFPAGSPSSRARPHTRGYDRLVILRCTRKLLAVLKTSTGPGPQPEAGPEDWYANLLWLDRCKCVLLTHSGTLFSVFEPDLRAADLRDTRNLVTRLTGRELAAENLPATTFGSPDCRDLIVARTADRSVLGCMNDMALMCEYAVMDAGGLRNVDTVELNRALHRNINSARGYQRPVDLATRRAILAPSPCVNPAVTIRSEGAR